MCHPEQTFKPFPDLRKCRLMRKSIGLNAVFHPFANWESWRAQKKLTSPFLIRANTVRGCTLQSDQYCTLISYNIHDGFHVYMRIICASICVCVCITGRCRQIKTGNEVKVCLIFFCGFIARCLPKKLYPEHDGTPGTLIVSVILN